eukprot:TRINITY_DN23968_c0_g1_i1.p1 TRINITY_DN23968_c0_g1~~TRINITY_DN23968_c0_g1_i1.p1  ORF type:complete len:434 (-),score=41.35 TRINITY_DN23968_c0_g1_i1:189-1490(-)
MSRTTELLIDYDGYRRRPWELPVALMLAATVSNTVYLSFSSISREVAADFGFEVEQIESLSALSNVATAVGYIISAQVVDGLSVAACFAAGCTLSAVGCSLRLVGASYLHRYSILAAGSFVSSMGSAFFNVLPGPLAVRYFPSCAQGLATGLGTLGVFLGCFGGPFIGVLFKQQPARLIFVQFIATLIASPIFLVTCGKSSSARSEDESRIELGKTNSHEGFLNPIQTVLRIPGMWVLIIAYMVSNAAFTSFCSALEQMSDDMPNSAELNQLMAFSLASCIWCAAMFAGMASDKFGSQRVLTSAGSSAALSWLLCLFGWSVASPNVALAGWVLVVILAGGTAPTISFLLAARSAKRCEGTACALLSFTASITAACAQLATSFTFDARSGRKHTAQMLLTCWMMASFVSAVLFWHVGALLPSASRSGTNSLMDA